MYKRTKILNIFLSLILFVTFIVPMPRVKAAGEAVQVTKTISASSITVNEEAEVQLDIKGTPPVDNILPNDLILVIDKSGSMKPDKIVAAREAAKGFVDLMDFTKHQVGIVDYDSIATTRTFPLTTDAQSAKNYIDTIVANGSTETGYAIRQAMNALTNHRPEAQPVIVILTDGEATNTADAKLAAQEAKAAGIVFYTIALLNVGTNPDTSAPNLLLKEMATTAQHHHYVLGSTGLADIYNEIVEEIGVASAKNVVVTDTVAPEFEIVPGSYDNNIPKPTVNGNTLTWNFLELKDEVLSFKYKIRPKNKTVTGTFPVSVGSSIVYDTYNSIDQTLLINAPTLKVTFPKPQIQSITPDKSEISGGTEVTINGTAFRPGVQVTVNSVNATNIQYISENQIKATVPAGTQGAAQLRVKNDDGQYADTPFSYYAIPTVTSISPAKGELAGGLNVTIKGQYFLPGVKVYFNGKEATVKSSTSQSISILTPSNSIEEEVDVKVVNPDATETVVPKGFKYEMLPAPVITSINPAEGQMAGGNSIYIYGSNFRAGAKVQVGAQDAAITLLEANRMYIKVPATTQPGKVAVTVTNTDGQVATLSDAYNYLAPIPDPAPIITSIDPKEGKLEGGNYIYIYGSNFKTGAKVQVGAKDAAQIQLVEANRISIKVPAATEPGVVSVTVTNPDGQSASLTGAYTYLAPVKDPAPTITSIDAKEGQLEGGNSIFIYGSNFKAGAKVQVGTQDAAQIIFVEANRIYIKVPAATVPGAVPVTVTNPDGQNAVLADAYTYLAPVLVNPPIITSISVTSGIITGGGYTYVSGSNFQQGITAKLGGKDAKVLTFVNSSQIRVEIPQSSVEGLVSLEVTNPDGQSATLADAYTYLPVPPTPAPIISSLSKTSGFVTGGGYLYVNGSNFQSGITVKLGGNDAAVLSFVNASQIRISIPQSSIEGKVSLVVTNPDGQSATLVDAYTYLPNPPVPAPTITTLSRTVGSTNGGEYIIINGTGFQSGLKVTLGGLNAPVSNFYSSTQIRIMTPQSAIGGPVDLEIINPDNQSVILGSAFTYQIPIPVITSLSKATGDYSGGYYIYINGANFEQNAVVTVNNIPVSMYYHGATSLRILSMPSALAVGLTNAGGTAVIKVTNSTGASATYNFTYNAKPAAPIPQITRVNPASGLKTGGNMVYIYGTGFTSTMKIRIYDALGGLVVEGPISNYYRSDYAAHRMPAVTNPGSYTIKLVNEDGVESNGIAYQYN